MFAIGPSGPALGRSSLITFKIPGIPPLSCLTMQLNISLAHALNASAIAELFLTVSRTRVLIANPTS